MKSCPHLSMACLLLRCLPVQYYLRWSEMRHVVLVAFAGDDDIDLFDRTAPLLVVGCGKSTLSWEMYVDSCSWEMTEMSMLYVYKLFIPLWSCVFTRYREGFIDQLSIDKSEVAIAQMTTLYDNI
jgi:hypothetical protein